MKGFEGTRGWEEAKIEVGSQLTMRRKREGVQGNYFPNESVSPA